MNFLYILMAISLHYFIFVLLSLPLLTSSQSSNNITASSSLTAGANPLSFWTSPSKDFACGFQEIKPGSFLLAIWFEAIPEKTIIWSANRDHLAPRGSKVELTAQGLALFDPSSQEIWRAKLLDNAAQLSYGAMLNTGNFVLATRAGSILWQSFDEPTDTIMPTQVLNVGAQLIAQFSELNYSRGRFMMQLGTHGNLILYTTNFPMFHSINTLYFSSSTRGSGYQVVFNQTGFLYLLAKNGSILTELFSADVPKEGFYQRVILEYDGILRHYVRPKSSSPHLSTKPVGWSIKSFMPKNICTSDPEETGIEMCEYNSPCTSNMEDTGSGVCGYNSYCSLGDDKRPYCSCLPGYTLSDPKNKMGGCRQNFPEQSCGKLPRQRNFEFKMLQHVDWPSSDYESFANVTMDWCKEACLSDCFCGVAIHKYGNCMKMKLPLAKGRSNTSADITSFVKVINSAPSPFSPPTALPSPPTKSHLQKSSNKVWLVLLGCSGLANIILLGIVFLGIFLFVHYKKLILGWNAFQVNGEYNVRSFSYMELSAATNGFQEEIGSGAFGVVYKGVMEGASGSPIYIAVKKLDCMLQDARTDFTAEVSSIANTHHKNLVHLIGFCEEKEHCLLVYDYMRNGTLFDLLDAIPRPTWEQRLRIAQGIAEGLSYLHEDCSSQIIHCDIKPQNILLDDGHNARISDFGQAKLLRLDQTQTNTVARGTRGYVAPEWFKNMPITAKVDVYSFGVLLLEIICCRRNVQIGDCEKEGGDLLTDMAFECYQKGKPETLVKGNVDAAGGKRRLESMMKIALWCIQDDPNKRPTMRMVTCMLEGLVQVPEPPLVVPLPFYQRRPCIVKSQNWG